MKRLPLPAIVLSIIFLPAILFAQKGGLSNHSYIDPRIGNVGQLLEPTRPLVHLPNQVIRMAPDRKDYFDDRIASFPLTIVSHRLGEVFSIKPCVRAITPASWQVPMPWDYELEVNKPWYYSTFLIDDAITVEFAPGKKVGWYRFEFPADGKAGTGRSGENGRVATGASGESGDAATRSGESRDAATGSGGTDDRASGSEGNGDAATGF